MIEVRRAVRLLLRPARARDEQELRIGLDGRFAAAGSRHESVHLRTRRGRGGRVERGRLHAGLRADFGEERGIGHDHPRTRRARERDEDALAVEPALGGNSLTVDGEAHDVRIHLRAGAERSRADGATHARRTRQQHDVRAACLDGFRKGGFVLRESALSGEVVCGNLHCLIHSTISAAIASAVMSFFTTVSRLAAGTSAFA